MPTAAYSLPVQAPVDVIWPIVRECAEMPQRHRPEVEAVAITAWTADGLTRQIHASEGAWTEVVAVSEQRKTISVDVHKPEEYEGRVVYEVLVPGPESTQPTPRLGIRLYWKDQDGLPNQTNAERFSAKVKSELLSIKHAAEIRAAQMAG